MACLADQAHCAVRALQAEAPAVLGIVDLGLGQIGHRADRVGRAVALEPAHVRRAGDDVQSTDNCVFGLLPDAVGHAAQLVELGHVLQCLLPLVEAAAAVGHPHRHWCGGDMRVEPFFDVSQHANLVAVRAKYNCAALRREAGAMSGLDLGDGRRLADHSGGVLNAAHAVSNVSGGPVFMLGGHAARAVKHRWRVWYPNVRAGTEHTGRVV